MPIKPPGNIPAYNLHKATGQARVRVDGREYYLGPFGTAQSHEAYQRIINQWIAGGYRLPPDHLDDFSIDELIVRFMTFAETYYTRPDGSVTRELQALKYALRPVQELYGTSAV